MRIAGLIIAACAASTVCHIGIVVAQERDQSLNPQPIPPGIQQSLNPQPIPPGTEQTLNPQPIPPGVQQSLNPQPIPPGVQQSLNPQPIPPGRAMGNFNVKRTGAAGSQIKLGKPGPSPQIDPPPLRRNVSSRTNAIASPQIDPPPPTLGSKVVRGASPQIDPPPPGLKNKKTRMKSAARSKATPTPVNKLDQHQLGPSFVSSDTVTPVSPTSGKTSVPQQKTFSPGVQQPQTKTFAPGVKP